MGLSDSVDGSNAFPGAMASLKDLVPNPSTANQFIPRAASVSVYNFGAFTTPGNVTDLLVVGTRAYGFISTGRFAGHDEPFVYDMLVGGDVTVQNVTSANTPLTQPTTGDWVPPTASMVVPGRIIFTHPGYDGVTHMIGWLDISNASITFTKGNTVNGSNVISSIQDGANDSAPTTDGIQVGYLAAGTGIPVNTYVTGVNDGVFDLATTGNISNGCTTVSALGSNAGVTIGMNVAGVGFAAGTYVQTIPGNTSVTLNTGAIATAGGTPVNFSGGGNITLSNNATVTGNLTALTFTGGNATAPLYGAGNTAPFPLVAKPTCVAQFNGRAYYGVLNGVAWSDSLLPTQVFNANQALTLGDNTPVTALAGLPLANTVTGGVVQALIAFKGAGIVYQITGDQTTTLEDNAVEGSVGTLAPNTICNTPQGIAYVAPDGLRLITLSGVCAPPIGADGQGVNVPFLNAINPSRMCAAYNENTIRISVQNGNLDTQPVQEFWLHLDRKAWTGPHSFPAALIQSFPGGSGGNTFILSASGLAAQIWQSAVIPDSGSTYTENGAAMNFAFQPVLSPDNSQAAMNSVVESMLGFALPALMRLTISVSNEAGDAIDTIALNGSGVAGATWGGFTWGSTTWGPTTSPFQQYYLPWHTPLVFKQASWLVTGPSQPGFVIGNLNFKYEKLEYPIQ